jgi:hypothetical protein
MPIDWNITSNFVLAIFAIAGFIASGVVSVITLIRTKKMDEHNKAIQEKQVKISLFEKRYEIFRYFLDLIPDNSFLNLEIADDLFIMKHKVDLLFENNSTERICDICEQLRNYLQGDAPFPNYLSKVLHNNVENPSTDELYSAFKMYLADSLSEISTNMKIYNL